MGQPLAVVLRAYSCSISLIRMGFLPSVENSYAVVLSLPYSVKEGEKKEGELCYNW
jgi:hypothetical protein